MSAETSTTLHEQRSPVLSFSFLGTPRFQRDGEVVDIPAAKAAALLAYLALNRLPQSRERLLDLLWSESAVEAARKNLRNLLWTVHKALGDGAVRVEGNRLALSDSIRVDVWEFERLAAGQPGTPVVPGQEHELVRHGLTEALALYRGPLLQHLSLIEAPDFERWLIAERERLAQLHARAVTMLISLERMAGRWSAIVDLAQQALTLNPLHESFYRASMEAYASLGERSAALRQYTLLESALATELGVAPSTETNELRDAILQGKVSSVPPSNSVFTSPQPMQPALSQPKPASPFVGRQSEFAALASEWEAVRAGQTRLVLLTGEMGIGKTRLWQAWAAGLPVDTRILTAQCYSSVQELPFVPVAELLRAPAYMQQIFIPDSPVAPIWLTEAARLLPEIHTLVPHLPAPAQLPPEEERRRVYEALLHCVRALNARPLILFIDDLHWIDQASLSWLDYLLRHFSAPLLLVGTLRPEEASPAIRQQLAAWSRVLPVRRIALARLSSSESTELLAALGCDTADTVSERVLMESGGNPYFLIELQRAGGTTLPTSLVDLVRVQAGQLTEEARQVLQAAVILEPNVSFSLLLWTSGRTEDEVLVALDALQRSGLLLEKQGTDDGYLFTHPVVASILREELSALRRRLLHRRAAEAYKQAFAGRLAQVAGLLALHCAEAGARGEAASYADLAAEYAQSVAARAEVVSWLRRAIAWEPAPQRYLQLGQALHWLSELEEARAAYLEALEMYRALEDYEGMGRAYLGIADTHLWANQGQDLLEWAQRGMDMVRGKMVEPSLQVYAHFLLGAGYYHVGNDLHEAEMQLKEAAQLAATHNLPDLAARARFEIGNVFARRGELSEALVAYQEAIELARRAGNPYQETLGLNNLAYHSLLAGNLPQAHAYLAEAFALVERQGLLLPRQWLLSTQGELALAEEKWDEAEQWFLQGMREAERQGNRVQIVNIQALLARLQGLRGDWQGAQHQLQSAFEQATALTSPYLQAQIAIWLAQSALATGRDDGARLAVQHARELVQETPYHGLQRQLVALNEHYL